MYAERDSSLGLSLKSEQPSDSTLRITDCGWLASLTDLLASKGVWCQALRHAGRAQCEVHYVSGGDAAGLTTPAYRRCVWDEAQRACTAGALFLCVPPSPPPLPPPRPRLKTTVGKGKGGGGNPSHSEGGGEAAAAPSGKKTPDPPPVVDVVGVVRDAKGGKATAMLAPVAPTHSWPIEFYVASLGLASGGKRTTSVVNLPTADSGDGTGGAWPHVSFPNLACDGAYDVWVMTCNKVGCSDKAHVAPFECDDFAAPPPPPPLPAGAHAPPHPPLAAAEVSAAPAAAAADVAASPPPPAEVPPCAAVFAGLTELRSQSKFCAAYKTDAAACVTNWMYDEATASGQRCLYDASRKPSACYKAPPGKCAGGVPAAAAAAPAAAAPAAAAPAAAAPLAEPTRDELRCYAERYPDLSQGFCKNPPYCQWARLAEHWKTSGVAEGRTYACAPPPLPAAPPPPPPKAKKAAVEGKQPATTAAPATAAAPAAPQVACTPKAGANDISYEACQPWCKEKSCEYCKCKACDVCKPSPK